MPFAAGAWAHEPALRMRSVAPVSGAALVAVPNVSNQGVPKWLSG